MIYGFLAILFIPILVGFLLYIVPINNKYTPKSVRKVRVVKVQFNDNGKKYTYLAGGGNYFKGDIIVVPFGPENKDRIGIVSSVDNVPFDELPVPEYEMKVPGGVLNRDIVRQNENHMP